MNMNREKSSRVIAADQIRVNKYLIGAFLLSTLVLLLPITFNQLPTTQVSTKDIDVSTNNAGIKVADGEQLCQALEEGDEITFKISGTLSELYNYQDLFQTSDLNAGIRFEINGLGEGGLLIGSNAPDGYSGLSVPGKFVVGKFDILIGIKDGSKVSVTFLNEETEKVFEGLRPTCDNFVIGYGYDSGRVIKGEVQFSATASYSKPRFVPSWLDNGVRVDWFRALVTSLFFFTALAMAFKLSTDTEDETEGANEKQDCI
jgi:hypothetical protein